MSWMRFRLPVAIQPAPPQRRAPVFNPYSRESEANCDAGPDCRISRILM
jgi:hypothetical protein